MNRNHVNRFCPCVLICFVLSFVNRVFTLESLTQQIRTQYTHNNGRDDDREENQVCGFCVYTHSMCKNLSTSFIQCV